MLVDCLLFSSGVVFQSWQNFKFLLNVLFAEVLEEALVGNDSEGPLCELLFFFLTAIFQAMAEEEEEVAKERITDADTKGQSSESLLIELVAL